MIFSKNKKQYNAFLLFLISVLSISCSGSRLCSVGNIIPGYGFRTIHLKHIAFDQVATFENEKYIILVDKNTILPDIKERISDSSLFNKISTNRDTLVLNKINIYGLHHIIEKQLNKKEAIVIDKESGKNIYKIKRQRYYRTSSHRSRVGKGKRGGIEYLNAKNDEVILDITLWISK